jgi:hypothetical protein
VLTLVEVDKASSRIQQTFLVKFLRRKEGSK